MERSLREIATLEFFDAAGRGKVWLKVRANPTCVALVLSVEHDGDAEVSLVPADARKVLAALGEAVADTSEL